MKTKLNVLILSVTIMASTQAVADELNVGKSAPSAGEIINHFTKSPADASASDPEQADDDISEQVQAFKGRGINILKSSPQAASEHKPAKAHKAPIVDVAAMSTKKPSDELALSMEVLFAHNSAELTGKAVEQLEPIAQALTSPEMKGFRFKIEGHTDASGNDEYNINLSLRRAQAVKEYLTKHYAIETAAIEVEGKGKYGLADPVDPTSETNRRVRLVKLGD